MESGVAIETASDAPAFEEIVRPHLAYLYALALRLCGARDRAEDVVQDALLRAFRAFPHLRNKDRPRLWLTRVLTSSFHDYLRRNPRLDKVRYGDDDEPFDLFDAIVEEDPFPYSDRVHLDFLELFDDEHVIEVLQRLHPGSRETLILAYVYGFTAQEIGKITGAPLGTVLARLARGRKQLERGLWNFACERGLLKRSVRT